MVLSLSRLHARVAADPGLIANVRASEFTKGLAALDSLSALLISVIDRLGVNRDGLLTEADLEAVSDAIRTAPDDYRTFVRAHGDDEWDGETGYHLLQNDGGTLMFQGRKFVDTVVDAIFHVGFTYDAGRFVNEDGNQNETVADVAGWLNYFLNGVNVVHGSDGDDDLYSGQYSAALAQAEDETFLAGLGDDEIWAGVGNDMVWAGAGHDKSGGGEGNDTLQGEAGNDTLYGDNGDDRVFGGIGDDVIGLSFGTDSAEGGAGNDTLYGQEGADVLAGDDGDDLIYGGEMRDVLRGGAGDDTLAGDADSDALSGEAGSDELHGGDGADRLSGGDGADTLSGGAGADVLNGGAGADKFYLWESVDACDTLVFRAGDSGKTRATIDSVEGFDTGIDKIDLRSFAGMVFEDLDYRGGGTASVYHDGRHLRIDGNGDGVTDMIIEFKWVSQLVADDFLFA